MHTDNRTLIATPDLAWSQVLLPTTTAALSGIGTQHGLVEGSTVAGFFRDKSLQDFVVTHSAAGLPQAGYKETVADKLLVRSEETQTFIGSGEGFSHVNSGPSSWKKGVKLAGFNDPIQLTYSLRKYDMNYLFKLLVNDYNVVMFNILEYIHNKVESKILEKIYHSCLLYDNYETFKTIHNIYECKYSIFYAVIVPIYYCSHISIENITYNSYISRSIIYTQMKYIYIVKSYEMYIILLYLYVYYKHNHIYKLNKLNSKITTHYIKLYNLLYGNNLKAIHVKKLL